MQKFEITLKGQTNTYEIPTNWLDVSVGTFVNVYKLQKTFTEDDSHLANLIKMFSLLMGVDEEVLRAMDAKTFGLLRDKISFLYDSADLAKVVTTDTIRFEDKTLYVNHKFDELTVEDIIRIEGITKNNNDLVDAMIPLLSYLIREKDENGKLVKSNVDMSNIRVVDVYSLILGFSNGVLK